MTTKKLYRPKYDRMIAGVCSGLGEYFHIDPTLIRLIFIFLCIFTGILPLVIAYLIAILVIPPKPESSPEKHLYKKLYRSKKDRKIAGICGGIGEIISIDPVFLRLFMIFLCFVTGIIPLVLAYLIGWIIIPQRP